MNDKQMLRLAIQNGIYLECTVFWRTANELWLQGAWLPRVTVGCPISLDAVHPQSRDHLLEQLSQIYKGSGHDIPTLQRLATVEGLRLFRLRGLDWYRAGRPVGHFDLTRPSYYTSGLGRRSRIKFSSLGEDDRVYALALLQKFLLDQGLLKTSSNFHRDQT